MDNPSKPLSLLARFLSWALRLDAFSRIDVEVYGGLGYLWRQFIDLFPYSWQHWWTNHIRIIYAPQHSNLRAAIPKTWCDIDGCIEQFLFACVIDFVEGENGLKDWEGQDQLMGEPWDEGTINPRRAQAAMLREVYDWAKTGRQAAEDAMFAAAPKVDFKTSVWEGITGDYTEYRRIEDEMEAKTERYLAWVVANRRLMWT